MFHSVMVRLQQLAAISSIILINPFHPDNSGVWTYPKYWSAVVFIGVNLVFIFSNLKKMTALKVTQGKAWKVCSFFFGAFVLLNTVSTLTSIVPERAFYGSSMMGDGLFYVWTLAVLVLSEIAVVRIFPDVFWKQVRAFLVGGLIAGLAVVFQVVNYQAKFDFFLNLSDPGLEMLLLGLDWDFQMPWGLYSHRGHAAYSLSFISLLFLWTWLSGRLRARWALPGFAFCSTALVMTLTRGPIFAGLAGAVFLFIRARASEGQRRLLLKVALPSVVLAGALVFGLTKSELLTPRGLTNMMRHFFQEERFTHIKMATKGALIKPWFGWGQNGFATAYPFASGCLDLRDLPYMHFEMVDLDKGQRRPNSDTPEMCKIPTTKAHSLLFDYLVALGFPATILFLLFYFWAIKRLAMSRRASGLISAAAAFPIAYLIYAMTWYDCSQYTHLIYWFLAAMLGATDDDTDRLFARSV